MSKQRLSGLQKWILKKCYAAGETVEYHEQTSAYCMWTKELYTYYNLLAGVRDDDHSNEAVVRLMRNRKRAAAGLSRSMRGLYRKGLVDVFSHGWESYQSQELVNVWFIRCVRLTSTGILKAQELLTLTLPRHREVNNKPELVKETVQV